MYHCSLMAIILLSDCHSWSLLNAKTPTGSCCLVWKVQGTIPIPQGYFYSLFFLSLLGIEPRIFYMLVSHDATELQSPSSEGYLKM